MTKYRIKAIINGFWAVPVVLLIRIIAPFKTLKVAMINSGRIGHFVFDVGEYIYQEKKNEGTKTKNLFYLDDISNSYWEKITKKHLTVFGRWFRYVVDWNEFIPGGNRHKALTATGSRDIENHYSLIRSNLTFSEDENREARKILQRYGWKIGDPFICLIVRDDKYLSETFPNNDWAYHNYRNSEISTYEPAMLSLANQGFWVFRMGKSMNAKLEIKNPRIIDYAFEEIKSDFMDVWLFSNANGCISTGLGPDAISLLFDVPQLYVNYLPLTHIPTFCNGMFYPKKLVWSATGESLLLRESLKIELLSAEAYTLAGIGYHNLSSNEVTAAVQESVERFQNRNQKPIESGSRQESFWITFKNTEQFNKYHSYIHPNARVAETWLNSLPEDYFS